MQRRGRTRRGRTPLSRTERSGDVREGARRSACLRLWTCLLSWTILSGSVLSGCGGDEGDLDAPGPIPEGSPRLVEASFIGIGGQTPVAGDTVVLRFDRSVVVQGRSTSGFSFARPGDTFGIDAALGQSVPGSDRVEIRLGDGAVLVPGDPGVDPDVTLANIAYSGSDLVQVEGTNGLRAARARRDAALGDRTAGAPVLVGARLVDADQDGVTDSGDLVVVTFDVPIRIPAGSSVSASFLLPVPGDSFGAGATLAPASSLEANRAAAITLGSDPVLTPDGTFDAAFLAPGSPSGLEVAGSTTIVGLLPTKALSGIRADVGRRAGAAPGDGRAAESLLGPPEPPGGRGGVAGATDPPAAQPLAAEPAGGAPDPSVGGGGQAGILARPADALVVGGRLLVADTGHHRVLIYGSYPVSGDAQPLVVLGQADRRSTEPNRGGTPSLATLRAPTGLASDGTRLAVADTGNHRILIWSAIPTAMGTPADIVIGQEDPDGGLPNVGRVAGPNTLKAPRGLAASSDAFVVADTENHRVLVFGAMETLAGFDAARAVVGQASFGATLPNRGLFAPTFETLKAPEGVLVDGTRLCVADTGNHRVLLWKKVLRPDRPGPNGAGADGLYGQGSFESASAAPASDVTLLGPSGLAMDAARSLLVVSDTGHHRIVFYADLDGAPGRRPSAVGVLGQATILGGAANRGAEEAGLDTLSGPRGIFWNGYDVVVADTGNDRVAFYR